MPTIDPNLQVKVRHTKMECDPFFQFIFQTRVRQKEHPSTLAVFISVSTNPDTRKASCRVGQINIIIHVAREKGSSRVQNS